MQPKRRNYRFGLVAAAITLLVGCASAPPGTTITFDQLQDPDTTLPTKWSNAMFYMKAMDIHGMRDLPRELVETTSHPTHGSGARGVVNAPTVGLSAVSPPTGMSGGASLGLGLGLMLLSAPIVQSAQVVQVAAWVPADLASSPEEAAKLAEFTYNEAREKVFVKRLPPNTSTTTYPNASGRAYGFKFPKKSNLMLFRAEAQTSPEFIKSRTSYGPIFIYGHKLSQEVILNTPGFVNIPGGREKIIAFSAVLPDWFVIYDTAKSYKGTEAPPVILQGGEIHHFIGR